MFKKDQKLLGNVEFDSRVKCLCMWYNLTEQLRSKIDILGLILIGLGATRKVVPWPSWTLTSSNIQDPSEDLIQHVKGTVDKYFL